MLITELKSKETIQALANGKVFIVNCHGCKEIRFPEHEAEQLQKELAEAGHVTGVITTDYICNPENTQLFLQSVCLMLGEADLLAAVAVDDESLLADQRQDRFLGFQFSNQHITSSPLLQFCRL